jgi:hypothetical protein
MNPNIRNISSLLHGLSKLCTYQVERKKNKATFVDQAGKVFPLWGIWVRKFAKQPEIDELQTGNWILETGNKETGNRKQERPFD